MGLSPIIALRATISYCNLDERSKVKTVLLCQMNGENCWATFVDIKLYISCLTFFQRHKWHFFCYELLKLTDAQILNFPYHSSLQFVILFSDVIKYGHVKFVKRAALVVTWGLCFKTSWGTFINAHGLYLHLTAILSTRLNLCDGNWRAKLYHNTYLLTWIRLWISVTCWWICTWLLFWTVCIS